MIDSGLIRERWINQLPEKARYDVMNIASKCSYEADELIFRKGDKAIALYGVSSGRVRVSATTYEGDKLVSTVLMPGEWFGEISVLDGQGRTHDTQAVEDSELVVLPLTKLSELMAQHPSIRFALVDLLCEKVRQAYMVVDEFLLCTPKERLANRLIYLFDLSADGVKASQDDLSKFVGISRQSVNKYLKEWEADGVIEREYGMIRIVIRESLESVSG